MRVDNRGGLEGRSALKVGIGWTERMVVAENKESGSCRRRDRNDGVPGVG